MATTPIQEKHARMTRFGDSWLNALRITTVRIVAQSVIFVAFLAFVVLTSFANLDRFPGLRLWVSKFLQVDPLVSIATAITTHTVYKGLLWSLVVLIPTLFLGRVFCNWICPYGSLHQVTGWLFRKVRPKETIEVNRYGPSQRVKYYILAAMLVAAMFGTLQIGLLDPICLIYRSFTGAILPAVKMPAPQLLGDYRLHQGAWLIGFLLFGLVAMNLIIPRFFCRVLCPLGALLGLLSRFSWWRIERDPDKCNGCDRCRLHCEGASDPHAQLRKSECLVCFNCIEECPEGALSFAFLPAKEHEVTGPDVPRRRVIFASIIGVLFFPFVRTSGRSTRNFSAKAIRPPGAVEELEFLKRCIKCDQCVRVCPTNVLQPGLFEAGLEGLWSPVLNFRMGACQYICTACGHVCPTGAIQRLSVEQKWGIGEFAERGPVKIGTAHFDTGRCLPYSKNITCQVCEEVCPTSPKAIYTERELRRVRDGRMIVVSSTHNAVTVGRVARVFRRGGFDSPEVMMSPRSKDLGHPASFAVDEWKGNGTTTYYVSISHSDGLTETHRIISNNVDTLTIEGIFARVPARGTSVVIQIELRVPRVDIDLCIGCGICERECPVVGDRRAIYITAEGETRSQNHPQRDRNRSLTLIKT